MSELVIFEDATRPVEVRLEGMRLTLNEQGLMALTLLIAESDPKAKDLVVAWLRLPMRIARTVAEISGVFMSFFTDVGVELVFVLSRRKRCSSSLRKRCTQRAARRFPGGSNDAPCTETATAAAPCPA